MSDFEDSEDSVYTDYTDNSADFAINFLYDLSFGINEDIKKILNSKWFFKNINKCDIYSFPVYFNSSTCNEVNLTFLEEFGLWGHQYSSGNIRVYVENYPVQNNSYNEEYDKTISKPVIFLNDAIRTILLQRRGILRELVPMLLDMIRIKY